MARFIIEDCDGVVVRTYAKSRVLQFFMDRKYMLYQDAEAFYADHIEPLQPGEAYDAPDYSIVRGEE